MESEDLGRVGQLTINNNPDGLISHFKEESDRLGIHCAYDINDVNHPGILVGTEFLSGLGGFYISPSEQVTRYRVLARALVYDVEKKPLESFLSVDKYNMVPYCGKGAKTLMLLPGDNIFNAVVDKESMDAIAFQGDYIAKPHPISCNDFVEWLNSNYVACSGMYSAYELIDLAERVALTGASELFVYSMLKGKEVIDISYALTSHSGGYSVLFKYIMSYPKANRVDVLLSLLSNWKSGVCFSKEDITSFLEFYKENYL